MSLKPTTQLLLRGKATTKNKKRRAGLAGMMKEMQQKKGKTQFRKTRVGALQKLEAIRAKRKPKRNMVAGIDIGIKRQLTG